MYLLLLKMMLKGHADLLDAVVVNFLYGKQLTELFVKIH